MLLLLIYYSVSCYQIDLKSLPDAKGVKQVFKNAAAGLHVLYTLSFPWTVVQPRLLYQHWHTMCEDDDKNGVKSVCTRLVKIVVWVRFYLYNVQLRRYNGKFSYIEIVFHPGHL